MTSASCSSVAATSDPSLVQRVQTPLGAVSYRRAGEGACVHVLLHGIGSASGSWQAQLDAARGRPDICLMAWDAPGYGQSDPVAPLQPETGVYADHLWAWLDALGVREPVVLVGHSLGTLIAARAALQRRPQVKRMVLLSPTRGYGHSSESERERLISTRLGQLSELGPEAMARSRAPAMLSAQAKPEWIEQVRRQMAALRPAGYTQAVHMLARASLMPDLQQLRASHLAMEVASGQADTVTPPATCDEVAAAAGVNRLSLGAVGHACAVEAAQAVMDLIDRPSENLAG